MDNPLSNQNQSFSGVISALQQGNQLLSKIQQAIATKFPDWVSVPASATAAGTAGQVAYDATHFYVCITSGTAGSAAWVRCTLATF